MRNKKGLEFHFTEPPPNVPFASFVTPLNKDKETNEQIKRRVMRESYLERRKQYKQNKQ